MRLNPLHAIDFYKADHRSQYPEKSNNVYANFTPRSARLAMGKSVLDDFDDKVVWIGIQAWIIEFLIQEWNDRFFIKPKDMVVQKYKNRMDNSLGEGVISVNHIEELHDLGYLPLSIKSLPEGSRVNIKVPAFTVTCTDPRFFWLVNYIETVASSDLWKTPTAATIAHEYNRLLTKYAKETGAPLDFVPFQAHDFSARGMSGRHDAARTGIGHLVSFVGTDTVSAIDFAEDYYDAGVTDTGAFDLIGASVPATEHSVISMGTKETEIETFRRLIKDVYPSGIVSIVADTWDFWKVITTYTETLKEQILNRTPNSLGIAKVVFRPDSGDPVKILCGYKYDVIQSRSSIYKVEEEVVYIVDEEKYFVVKPVDTGGTTEYDLFPIKECEVKGAVECLWDIFGGTTTVKGYKILNDRVGLIYGDSITLERASQILSQLKDKGFASCNVVLGIGSYTYQYVTRDTFGWAMKATYGEVDGEPRELSKDPVTDNGTKKSAVGLLRVEKEGKDFVLYDQQTKEQEAMGELKEIFRNGKLISKTSFYDIRQRLKAES